MIALADAGQLDVVGEHRVDCARATTARRPPKIEIEVVPCPAQRAEYLRFRTSRSPCRYVGVARHGETSRRAFIAETESISISHATASALADRDIGLHCSGS